MNKHPYNRKVFFVRHRDDFLSLNEVREDVQTGRLALSEYIFDTDGGAYPVQHVATNKAPRWLQNEPILGDLPPLSEEDMAMVNELLCEEDFLEMPKEPSVKSVSHYLESNPRIARMVADAQHCMLS